MATILDSTALHIGSEESQHGKGSKDERGRLRKNTVSGEVLVLVLEF